MAIDLDRHIQSFTRVAVDLASSGAELAFGLMGKTAVSLKDDHTVVTEADHRVQEMIVQRLRRLFPTHGIIAEEASDMLKPDELERECVWVIDPIDGTRCFAAGIPSFTCSVAMLYRHAPAVAAIALPRPRMIFHTSLNEPTRLNNQPVRVTDRPLDQRSVIAVSGSELLHVPEYLRRWAGVRIVRDFGSVAYHIALVAAGKLDAAINFKGKLWDVAAAALLLDRAGGTILRLDDRGIPNRQPLWPINPKTHRREPLPLLACSPAAANQLQTEMT